MGMLPAGGVTWDYIQYPLGFTLLGHDVWYIEDTRIWPVFQPISDGGSNSLPNVAYLASVMERFGMSDRWAYRDEVSDSWFGMSAADVGEICRTADLLVNVSCANVMRDEYLKIPHRVLIDSDPMFTQAQYELAMAFHGTPGMREAVAGHNHHFSFGERIGQPDCQVPRSGVTWLATRQPVCLDAWPVLPLPAGRKRFTTVMNWTAARDFEFQGQTWGQKNVEFAKVMELPGHVPDVSLEVAVAQTGKVAAPFPSAATISAGWTILDPAKEVPDTESYRAFIQRSSGEFSVAKEAYVKARTGWFSGRSACYLASGRPVVAQDTGWSEIIPAGNGLFAFNTMEDAVEAVEAITASHPAQSQAARGIAEEYFDSSKVLGSLLARVSP